MKRQPNLILQSPFIYILQEKILMKNLNTMFNNPQTLYVGKEQPNFKGKYQKFKGKETKNSSFNSSRP